MSRFNLLYDVKNAMERLVNLNDLLAALFADHPDLKTLTFEVTNEYDDNNYSDYSRLYEVNGWQVDYDGEFDEADEDEEHDLPKPSNVSIQAAMSLCEAVKEKHGYGTQEFDRDDYDFDSREKQMKQSPELLCVVAVMQGKKVPAEVVAEAGGNWWSHYAEIYGRFSEEDEFAIFAREGMMGDARQYAEKFGPLSDKTLNYFVLSLTSEDGDYYQLQDYLEWLKARAA